MEIDILRDFLVVADELNYTKAAKRLHISQSTLSKHIASLEKELGETLLIRKSRGVELTQSGAIFYRSASTVVEIMNRTYQEFQQMKQQIDLRITGLLQNNDILMLLSRTMQILNEDKKDSVTLSFISDESESSIDALLNNHADLAILFKSYSESLNPELACIELFKEKLIGLMELEHPLGNRQFISIDDLKDYPLAFISDNYANFGWDNILHICSKYGFKPRTTPIPANSFINILTMPLGESILLLQKGATPTDLLINSQRNVVGISNNDAEMTVCAYYRKSDNKKLERFLLTLQAALPQDVQEPFGGRGRFKQRCESFARSLELTENETIAMMQFARGSDINRIASDLGLTRMMVGDLLASVYKKADVRDRQDLLDKIEAVELPW